MTKQRVMQSLQVGRTVRATATLLGCSERTLLRRMREWKIKIPPRGRPRFAVFSSVKEHEELTQKETRRWLRVSIEERISAVEVIREETAALYGGQIPKRMARVSRFIGEAPRKVPHRGRARTRRAR